MSKLDELGGLEAARTRASITNNEYDATTIEALIERVEELEQTIDFLKRKEKGTSESYISAAQRCVEMERKLGDAYQLLNAKEANLQSYRDLADGIVKLEAHIKEKGLHKSAVLSYWDDFAAKARELVEEK